MFPDEVYQSQNLIPGFSSLEINIQNHFWLNYLTSTIIVLILGLWLNNLFESFGFLGRRSYIIYFVFGVFSALYAQWNQFSAFLLAQFLVVYFIKISQNGFQEGLNTKSIFDISLIASIGFLLFPPLIVLFPLVFWLSFTAGKFHLRNLAISTIGFLLPLYFLWSAMYLFDISASLSLNPKANLLQTFNSKFNLSQDFPIILLFLGLIPVHYHFLSRMSKNKARITKFFTFIIVLQLFLIAIGLLKEQKLEAGLSLASSIYSFMLAVFIVNHKKPAIIKLTLLFILGGIVSQIFVLQ